MRLDKWLWAARFFKTRNLAATAVHGGRVRVNGKPAKPGRPVVVGDRLEITRGPIAWTVVVAVLGARRGPAAEAATLYEETPESRSAREAAAAAHRESRLQTTTEGRRGPRPSKRDRRRTDRLRGERFPSD